MLNFKKIVAVVLSIIMISSFSLGAIAASTSTDVNLTSSFDDSGQYLQVKISTTNAVAGMKGTFTYNPVAVELLVDQTVFYNSDNVVDNSIKYTAGSVELVLLGDVVNGTTKWVTFSFRILKTASVTFGLSNISVCNVDEQNVTTTINNKTINVSVEALVTLGAQVRTETATETTQDLRFGSKLVRSINDTAEYIVVGGNTYKATAYGYLVALTSRITNNNVVEQMTVDYNNTSIKNVKSTKCYLNESTYFIYTLAVTGITSANESTNISVRPYVVYDVDGVSHYLYGEQISKCVTEVEAVAFK